MIGKHVLISTISPTHLVPTSLMKVYKTNHSSCEMKKSGDQFPRKVTTCSRHYKPKLILPLKSVLLYKFPFTLKIAFEKMKLFKMHQIIKPTWPNRQLFIKITFAFIKIFDFLVKIAIFGAFLSQSSRFASRVTARNG